jgi:hypothetical protein
LKLSGNLLGGHQAFFSLKMKKNEKKMFDGNDFEGNFLPLLMQVEYLIICCAIDENEFK